MAWRIGQWQEYEEGEIHQTLKKCINIFIEDGFSVYVDLAGEKKKIEYGKHLYETLLTYEKTHGLNDLLEILTKRLEILCSKEAGQNLDIRVLLRTPSDTEENKDLFKSMVVEWVEQNPLSFCERFFRLPKITEDMLDRYGDCTLEQALKRVFGFKFMYMVIIDSKSDSPALETLRKKLYRALRP